ncbi:unnamed protein product [Caenorhabditis angaria]|uniref:Uncharacterized protein n=1 Tax=Caenorhabditis angaria TaxID=860376 RepID=A0A9P1IZQ7_9PELO|nr:unnamed protein product [Caenorhabditis angaria]
MEYVGGTCLNRRFGSGTGTDAFLYLDPPFVNGVVSRNGSPELLLVAGGGAAGPPLLLLRVVNECVDELGIRLL